MTIFFKIIKITRGALLSTNPARGKNLNLIRPSTLSHIYSQTKGKGKIKRKQWWISELLLLLQKWLLLCQLWLALAHGDLHALYLDPPGKVWNPEISPSTKHVILGSVESRLAPSQWKLKSRPWKQRMTVNTLTLLLNAVTERGWKQLWLCVYGNCCWKWRRTKIWTLVWKFSLSVISPPAVPVVFPVKLKSKNILDISECCTCWCQGWSQRGHMFIFPKTHR